MPPKAHPPFDQVENSNFLVLKAEIKKSKTIITSNIKTLDLEILKLKKVPPPTLFRKRSHMATIEHCRATANAAMSSLRDLNTSSEVMLTELVPKSNDEVEAIQASIRDLHEGETKYSNIIDEFDDVNGMFIEDIVVEVNSGHSSGMPPPSAPPADPGIKYVKHDK